MLGGDEGIAEPVGLVLGVLDGLQGGAGQLRLLHRAARGGRQRLDGGAGLHTDGVRIRAGGTEKRDGDPLPLIHQRLEQVGRLHLGISGRGGVHGCSRKSLLALGGEFDVQRELLPGSACI